MCVSDRVSESLTDKHAYRGDSLIKREEKTVHKTDLQKGRGNESKINADKRKYEQINQKKGQEKQT